MLHWRHAAALQWASGTVMLVVGLGRFLAWAEPGEGTREVFKWLFTSLYRYFFLNTQIGDEEFLLIANK